VSRAYDTLLTALKGLEPKPPDSVKPPSKKKAYSEKMSAAVAAALAEELRQRGLQRARPGGLGELGLSGAERRMSGGIGAKKVDVTWATEESGLLLAISVKCINFVDLKTKNFQKNLTNRRGDMLFESVTLHRRFPYAVLGGFFILDKGAAEDGTSKRASTFLNAHRRLRLFTGRSDPAGRDEQYEHLFVVLVDATPFAASARIFEAGNPKDEITLDRAMDLLLRASAERDPDFYILVGPNGEVEPDATMSPLSLRSAKRAATGAKKAAPEEEDEDYEDDGDEES
jgi:hypothetical protein